MPHLNLRLPCSLSTLYLQSSEPVSHRNLDSYNSLRISIPILPLKTGSLTFKTIIWLHSTSPKACFSFSSFCKEIQCPDDHSFPPWPFPKINLSPRSPCDREGCWVVAILGKTEMYDRTLGYRWCYHYWFRHHWWRTLSQWWTDHKDVWGSLTPMASSLVFFRAEIDFIAQKSFSVLAAHLWPFINTTAGGSEGTEGTKQAQGWPSFLGETMLIKWDWCACST